MRSSRRTTLRSGYSGAPVAYRTLTPVDAAAVLALERHKVAEDWGRRPRQAARLLPLPAVRRLL